MKTTSPIQGQIALITAIKKCAKTFGCQQWIQFKRMMMDEVDTLIQTNMTQFMFRLPESSIKKLHEKALNISTKMSSADQTSDFLSKLSSMNVLSNVGKFLTQEENAAVACVNRELLIHTHTKSHILNRRTPRDSPLVISYNLLQKLPLYAKPNSIQYYYSSNVICNIRKYDFNIEQWLNKHENLSSWLSFFTFVNHLTIDLNNTFILPHIPIETLFDVKNKQPINITFKFDNYHVSDFTRNESIKEFGIAYNEYWDNAKQQQIRPINKLTFHNVTNKFADRTVFEIIKMFGANFSQLHLDGCHMIVHSLPQLLLPNVTYLQMSNFSKLYLSNHSNNNMIENEYHVRTLRIEQMNSVWNDWKSQLNIWRKHSLLNELQHLIVDLNLLTNEGYYTTLICKYGNDYGWLYYLLDPTYKEIDCPKLQQIEINVVIAQPTQLCLLIDEISGLEDLPQYPNELMEICINVKFVNYDIDAPCNRFDNMIRAAPDPAMSWIDELDKTERFGYSLIQARVVLEYCQQHMRENRYFNCERSLKIPAGY